MKKSKSFKFYFGIPHSHTSFSTGLGSTEDAYYHAYNNELDFLVITDHNNYLQKSVQNNKKNLSKWDIQNIACQKFNKKYEKFMALTGFEAKTCYGDINIINSSTYFTGTVNNYNLLILWIINNPYSIITINHPHKDILNLEYNELINKLITSIEVGNGCYPNKYIRYDKYYYALLDKGWKLGAINSQDNHKINFGDFDNLTAVIMKDFTVENLIESFRNRKTYSTESRSLKMYFTINNNFMGSTMDNVESKLRFTVYAEDNKFKINSIEIVTNHNTIIKKITDININSIKYIYEHEKRTSENWYVIRVHLDNNKRLAISSPIFTK